MRFEQTELLNIAFEMEGAPDAPPVFLLHGWPDAPIGWKPVAQALQQRGFRTIAPYLRGSHPTAFLSHDTPRYAVSVAMAQDVIDLADKLGIARFHVIGHDWGARTAYSLSVLFPERVQAIVTLALPYQPRGEFQLRSFDQARRYWYQFFQCTEAGADVVRRDPVGFARVQWETWSPAGWFTEEDFKLASEHFDKPDWVETTLNAYRSRYLPAEAVDPRYDALRVRLRSTREVLVPTTMIQGGEDYCDLPSSSEGQEAHFFAGYERIVLAGVGHFPHREAPAAVVQAALRRFGPARG
ncbi:MAG TPA: alpha/beta hydrolase [Dyella sp.]|uniref:alpha/beta fold hydrolase n=1 Tax=Dyella sp. TaxID=1869338 RepID=UPI002B853BFB|nr:alpha/beta hydrolase [Dyella sp.]HTV85024.1 alpha/beta hydrolase [Dyella sp.]